MAGRTRCQRCHNRARGSLAPPSRDRASHAERRGSARNVETESRSLSQRQWKKTCCLSLLCVIVDILSFLSISRLCQYFQTYMRHEISITGESGGGTAFSRGSGFARTEMEESDDPSLARPPRDLATSLSHRENCK